MALSDEQRLQLMAAGLGLDWSKVGPSIMRYGEPLIEIAAAFKVRGNSIESVQSMVQYARETLPAVRLLIQIEDSLPPE